MYGIKISLKKRDKYFSSSEKISLFKFSPYKIVMVILILHNNVVCKNSLYFENLLQKNWILLALQNNPYKMLIWTKSE